MTNCAVSVMLGLTITDIRQVGENEIFFTTSCGRLFKMYHEQNCCESVTIEDVAGDYSDLLDLPLLMSEDISNDDSGYVPDDTRAESETWTFYKFGTKKGCVTLRWYGSSNGYYSESVNFCELTAESVTAHKKFNEE